MGRALLAFFPALPVYTTAQEPHLRALPRPQGPSQIPLRYRTRRARIVTCVVDTFEQAAANGYVLEFGRQVPLTGGEALPSTDLCVPADKKTAIDDVLTLILRMVGRYDVRAVFLRGSAVTGYLFSDGRSDIDIVLFTVHAVPHAAVHALRRSVTTALQQHTCLASTDLSFHHARRRYGATGATFQVRTTLATVLRHYAVALHGSLQAVGIPSGWAKPTTHLARDIRHDERRFLSALSPSRSPSSAASQAETVASLSLQLTALQWLCKRCLRAMAELSCHKALTCHCRDLVPCFDSARATFPQHETVLLHALQIACACERTGFAGLTDGNGVLAVGTGIARDAVDVVEQVFLEIFFPPERVGAQAGMASPSEAEGGGGRKLTPFAQTTTPAAAEAAVGKGAVSWSAGVRAMDAVVALATSTRMLFTPQRYEGLRFRRDVLPPVALQPMRQAFQVYARELDAPKGCKISSLLERVSEPLVIRGACAHCGVGAQTSAEALRALARNNVRVECRMASSNVVTFCRAQHAWISDGTFTPPSVSRRLPVHAAIQLLLQPPTADNGSGDARPFGYIQTRARARQKVLHGASESNALRAAQRERIWISTHGAVSPLHYDASHSALLQRCGAKRLTFLPDAALADLPAYPLGHPLHRRARVDASRGGGAAMWAEFWERWGDRGVQVTVNAGDLVVFPPMWAHYTESLTESDEGVCVSHTFRFW